MILSLLVLLTLQDGPVGPPAPRPAPKGEPELLNGVYLVVNEEVVTYSQVYRELRRRNQALGSEEERQRALAENHAEFVRNMLMTQAGRDMGFDAERVNGLVEQDLERFVEQSGSVIQFGAELEQSNLDPQTLREQREAFYYRQLWLGSRDGRSQGAAGRAFVDRYVRPGRLELEFQRQDLEELFPSMILVQELNLDARRSGGAQAALERAKELRQRALDGEDFNQLVAENSHGDTARKGLWPKTSIARATQVLPELAQFFQEAHGGDVCEPLPVRRGGELIGYSLLHIVSVERQEERSFGQAEVQDKLRQRYLQRLSDWRRDSALVELFEAAYVWPAQARPRPNSGR